MLFLDLLSKCPSPSQPTTNHIVFLGDTLISSHSGLVSGMFQACFLAHCCIIRDGNESCINDGADQQPAVHAGQDWRCLFSCNQSHNTLQHCNITRVSISEFLFLLLSSDNNSHVKTTGDA